MTIPEKLIAFFADRGCAMPEISILQPADPFLETAGEDMRRRVFITSDEQGKSLCLRPEFTIPVCLQHLANDEKLPRRYGYCGVVFRQNRRGHEGGSEFMQAGIEDFGRTDAVLADVDCLADAHAALAVVGIGNTTTIFGDQSIFEAIVAAIGLPQGWQTRLVRAFGDEELLATYLKRLTKSEPSETTSQPITELISGGDVAAVEKIVAAKMNDANLPAEAGRTAVEIARRAIVKARLANTRLDTAQASALGDFLSIDVKANQAGDELTRFERDHALDLGAAKQALVQRLALLGERDIELDDFRYKASFGRKLDYYSGLLFEIYASGGDRPIVGGGRYDRLMTLLGSPVAVPAVGFSIWLDRLALAGEAT